MTRIVKASMDDSALLADLGKQTFIESHGHSAKKEDIDNYVKEKNSPAFFQQDLSDPANLYHIIYYNDQAAGYSKIILDCSHPNIDIPNVTKLERIYLLKKFYEAKLGQELFNFNLALSKENQQTGMWLYVWKENLRAFNFYKRNGFKPIGSYDFQVSPTHSNPNHHMLLVY